MKTLDPLNFQGTRKIDPDGLSAIFSISTVEFRKRTVADHQEHAVGSPESGQQFGFLIFFSTPGLEIEAKMAEVFSDVGGDTAISDQ
jgi:hypothetical protein